MHNTRTTPLARLPCRICYLRTVVGAYHCCATPQNGRFCSQLSARRVAAPTRAAAASIGPEILDSWKGAAPCQCCHPSCLLPRIVYRGCYCVDCIGGAIVGLLAGDGAAPCLPVWHNQQRDRQPRNSIRGSAAPPWRHQTQVSCRKHEAGSGSGDEKSHPAAQKPHVMAGYARHCSAVRRWLPHRSVMNHRSVPSSLSVPSRLEKYLAASGKRSRK